MLAMVWMAAAAAIMGFYLTSLLVWWNAIVVFAVFWLIHNLIASQFDKDPLIDKIYQIYSKTQDHYHPESRILDRMHERPNKFGRGVRC
jgi:hypothetical protein